jgi:hypothetical protein
MIPIKVQETIDIFTAELKTNSNVLGVLLVGSYATSQFTDTSDIDIKVILRPFARKRSKGVKILNGYHISYSAYSVMEAYDFFYAQLRTYSKFQARMISQGMILYDATGEMKHLKTEAQLVMQLSFVIPPITTLQLEAYNLWKYKDALLSDSLKAFTMKEYYVFLDKSLILYAKLLGFECIFQYPFFKMDAFISDAKFRERYAIPVFPDEAFLNLYQNGVSHTNTEDLKTTVSNIFETIETVLQIDFEQFEIAN